MSDGPNGHDTTWHIGGRSEIRINDGKLCRILAAEFHAGLTSTDTHLIAFRPLPDRLDRSVNVRGTCGGIASDMPTNKV